jgi:hypothetical protein
MKKNFLLFFVAALFSIRSFAGDTARVLFIGNSYTHFQQMPDLVAQLAQESGDVLEWTMSAPGGQTLQQHCTDPATLNFIAQGNWDFVVLQEQSQRPSFPESQVENEVYPYARKLDSLIQAASTTGCTRTVFFMTWGRKNGDADNCAGWPPVCTYLGMDSLLQLRYTKMAEDNTATIAPVAKVWRHIIENNPGIDLYQSDESHPSAAGTYASALTFYSLFFQKDPAQLTNNFIVNPADAAIIRQAANAVVFDSLYRWTRFDPAYPGMDSIMATYQGQGKWNFAVFNPTPNIIGYQWDFGDGSDPTYETNPTHVYGSPGTYRVCVTLHSSCASIYFCFDVESTVGISEPLLSQQVHLYPNPVNNEGLRIEGLGRPAQYTIYNIVGTQQAAGQLAGSGMTLLPTDKLPAGVYILRLNSGQQTAAFRFVKQD